MSPRPARPASLRCSEIMSQTGPNRDTLKDTGSRPARKRPRLGPKIRTPLTREDCR